MAKTKKILIVEDEPSLLEVLSRRFAKENITVLSARNGKEGLELALKEKPDLILLDIVMPSMSGLTMAEKLRQDKWGKNAKVMVLSNVNDTRKTQRALKNGIEDFFVKSDWRLEDIVEQVRDRLVSA